MGQISEVALSSWPDVLGLNWRAVTTALGVAVLMLALAGNGTIPQPLQPAAAPTGENWWPTGGNYGRWWRA
ncbi:MAG: hypothetical protein F4111_02220 [Acidimicrobiales bacterium]|nr:hypothetical protein [Acidimicrobiales bacterium]MYI08234.1 hypothetical protein [Acidimicrobiales bacterium]